MSTKIKDDSGLRAQIEVLCQNTSQIDLAKWALRLARHTLAAAGLDPVSIPEVDHGFYVNEQWQAGAARMHDVRQAGFAIHRAARASDNEITRAALRAVGQAVGTGHMKEHALVASDYAVKTVGMLSSGSMDVITAERRWQLCELNRLRQP